jgi:hypothetical protein|tara:strand:- start:42 stop:242 length:201 start_codon:yes stop_codon:yes gene_type:complete
MEALQRATVEAMDPKYRETSMAHLLNSAQIRQGAVCPGQRDIGQLDHPNEAGGLALESNRGKQDEK